MEINNRRQLEDKIFEMAVESGELEDYLRGIGAYKLSAGDMNPEVVINTGAIMRKIYDYYLKTKDVNLVRQFYISLMNLSRYKSFLSVFTVMDIERYQMEAEKKGEAPFVIDHVSVLESLSQNLKQNREFYLQRGELGNNFLPNGMINLIEKYNQEFSEKYGRRIM